MTPAQQPLVSVVVSARGNTAGLKSLLAALSQQTLPAARFEAVIVDNDLPGPIRPIADAIRDGDWPFTVRVLYEPTPGLSAGRNRGICAARGQYVAITDPDITPEPGWLQALVTAIEEEKVFAVGGRTHVTYPGGQVTALTKALRECHGAVDWPEGRALAVWPYWVTGCNLLFHRQTALDIGLFRTDLGRRGRWMGDCEDLEFIDRARQAGHHTLIEPAAVASHPVYRPETTLKYFLRQGAGHGVCVARMHLSVIVEPAAIQAGRAAVHDAVINLAAGWTFLDRSRAVEGARDLVRIGAYHLERGRLRLLGRRPIALAQHAPTPTKEPHAWT
ncbi:glycosyltransferase involved in cell wall biosynthesis [Streptomyces sp. SAI-208]|uniref:glycosyltransferase n=1 Tax=Streptomyces sp. SAI-208 TaxID=2940550 RepID=UPI002476E7F6|nr:glycosyltransferase [Streptomyces sp. SAI-208]MDH6604504.1 glycosyltransferase involved in cell wall biosynthesis [Streptomyces sp. SAI-208]